jgi:hypothetical protein
MAQQPTRPQSEAESAPATSPLTPRQQRVNRMMGNLERMLLSLARTLEKTEPERAERLVKAFQQSKELLIEQRMEEIVRLLETARLDSASDEQKKIIQDLSQLIELLLEEGIDPETLEEEIERLTRWRELIQKLVKEEEGHLRESDKIANKDETLADLERQIEAVKELIRRQEQVIHKTAAAAEQDTEQLAKLAGDQGTIRNDTQSLADEIASAGRPSGSSQGDSPSGGQAESDESPEGEAQTSEPGERPLREAAGHQQSAEKQLRQSDRQAAQGEEQESLEDLKTALAELEKERDRLRSPPAEVFPQLAENQDVTAQKTGQLSDEMAKASQAAGQSGGGQSGGAKCGQEQVASAGQCMQQASGQLQNQQAGAASKEQDKAIRELKKALEEIQQRLAELGEQMQEEMLVQLEDIFREMLDRQHKASADTVTLDGKERDADGTLRRAERLALKKLAQEERKLAEMAQQAYDLLVEDGTSIVFPPVVEDLRDGLETIAKLLDDQRTDDYTQTLQKEIETTLEELIDALQKIAGGGGGGGGGSCQGRPPLVTSTAELKLLRALQLRVNRRTKAFDKARPAELDDVMRTEITGIAKLQGEISHMVDRILERMQ